MTWINRYNISKTIVINELTSMKYFLVYVHLVYKTKLKRLPVITLNEPGVNKRIKCLFYKYILSVKDTIIFYRRRVLWLLPVVNAVIQHSILSQHDE